MILLAIAASGGVVLATRTDILPGRDASWIVRRSQEHAPRHTYTAAAETRINCQGKPMLSQVKIIHMRPDKCRMEYTSEPLKGVVVGNDGKNMWRYDPKTGRLVVSRNSGCGGADKRLHLLLDNHRIALAGRARVADREAYSLVVRPRDSARVRKRLWMDTRTFVILRQEDYDSHGKLQSSTRFNSIRFAKSFPDSLFQPPAGVRVSERRLGDVVPIEELSGRLGFTVRAPGYVPRGYKLDSTRLHECPCDCPHQSALIRYSDGLSSISVFESKAGSGCRIDAGCDKRTDSIDACRIRRSDRGEIAKFEREGISFVIVADLDSREIRKIADSIR